MVKFISGGYTLGVNMNNNLNIRTVYEPTIIRHIAVQCPFCGKWFNGIDITNDRLHYKHDIKYARFLCPICNKNFTADEEFMDIKVNIEESDSSNVYKDCLQKKEVWA